MAAAPVGDLTAALGHAVRLLATDPSLAAAQAEEILGVAPSDPRPALILGMARRRLGDDGGARDILEPLARAQPGSAQTQAAGTATAAARTRTHSLLDSGCPSRLWIAWTTKARRPRNAATGQTAPPSTESHGRKTPRTER